MRPLHVFATLTLWLSIILAALACSMLVVVSVAFPPAGVILLLIWGYLWFIRRR